MCGWGVWSLVFERVGDAAVEGRGEGNGEVRLGCGLAWRLRGRWASGGAGLVVALVVVVVAAATQAQSGTNHAFRRRICFVVG